MSYLEETKTAGREVFPDLARAWALIGIALVNVAYFAYPYAEGLYAFGGMNGAADFWSYFAVNALFTSKSYTLFSFMFGVGFAYQMASAERAGAGFAGRYWRRIIGLFFFAAVNIILLFQGDILFTYALLGILLFFFRKSSPSVLIKWAIGLYVVQLVFVLFGAVGVTAWQAYKPAAVAAELETMREASAGYTEAYSNGGFAETVSARVSEWSEAIFYILPGQGFGAMAFFLFGLAAVRNGLIADPSANFWRKSRRVYLPIGLIISASGAWFMTQATNMFDPNMLWGAFLITLGSPFATAGYLGILAKWSLAGDNPIKTFFARGGTASLTAYLLQGLLFTLVFYEYGLGLYAEIGAAACIGIALLVALLSIAFTSLWRAAFKRGPLEAVLRGWTYLGSR
ncbi:MAG: DUF418 domain-containing protein [Pseudomonadota bacterium]